MSASPIGLASSSIAGIEFLIKTYTRLLDIDRAEDQYNVRRVQILTQRARFSSWQKRIQQLGVIPDLPEKALLQEILLSSLKEFDKLQRFEKSIGLSSTESKRPSISQRLKFEFVKGDQLKEVLENLTILNDSLWGLLPQLELSAKQYSQRSNRPEEDPHAEQIETVDGSSQICSPLDSLNTIEPTFRNLVAACEGALQAISTLSEDLREQYLSFKLWAHAISASNGYEIFTSFPKNGRYPEEPDLVSVHFQAISHLIWILSELSPSPAVAMFICF
ncbi:hypothetical protein GP486_001526 [Trichoglossum hirsutum]|uniref:Uncharacterized protein n=1 Tax=Trichoglossum hirsutum TaxID=265104 RepID=A0A9P8LGI2_9PEZI|nr:hypothetical protein GP486_001526 [Trichoglossum hirsutum]